MVLALPTLLVLTKNRQ